MSCDHDMDDVWWAVVLILFTRSFLRPLFEPKANLQQRHLKPHCVNAPDGFNHKTNFEY